MHKLMITVSQYPEYPEMSAGRSKLLDLLVEEEKARSKGGKVVTVILGLIGARGHSAGFNIGNWQYKHEEGIDLEALCKAKDEMKERNRISLKKLRDSYMAKIVEIGKMYEAQETDMDQRIQDLIQAGEVENEKALKESEERTRLLNIAKTKLAEIKAKRQPGNQEPEKAEEVTVGDEEPADKDEIEELQPEKSKEARELSVASSGDESESEDESEIEINNHSNELTEESGNEGGARSDVPTGERNTANEEPSRSTEGVERVKKRPREEEPYHNTQGSGSTGANSSEESRRSKEKRDGKNRYGHTLIVQAQPNVDGSDEIGRLLSGWDEVYKVKEVSEKDSEGFFTIRLLVNERSSIRLIQNLQSNKDYQTYFLQMAPDCNNKGTLREKVARSVMSAPGASPSRFTGVHRR